MRKCSRSSNRLLELDRQRLRLPLSREEAPSRCTPSRYARHSHGSSCGEGLVRPGGGLRKAYPQGTLQLTFTRTRLFSLGLPTGRSCPKPR